MIFRNITTDKQTTYRLESNEKIVFFMLNRSGAITFELAGKGAEAHIFSFFIGRKDDKGTLAITQRHSAPQTTSHALAKSVLFDASEYIYEGLIAIGKQADWSDASQESRALLCSPLTQASSQPSLEILANDVKCRHAATASPLNQESLFFAESRGLSSSQAEHLLIQGFIDEAVEKIKKLGVDTSLIVKSLEMKMKNFI
ncbi:MAG: SufD family Fe-S cluster assembly protein [Candidatus Moraniibacteriota bacterium]